MWRAGWTGLAAAVLLCAAGCRQQPSSVAAYGGQEPVMGGAELAGQNRPPVPDVPVPMNFSLDEGRSRNFTGPGARYVDHVYKGSSDKFAVARFYKRQMPINRWTLVTDMFVQGNIMLDFEKNTERCRVTVTDGSLFHPTVIRIALWTSGRIVSPPAGPAGAATP